MAPLAETDMYTLEPAEETFEEVQPMKPVQHEDEGTVDTSPMAAENPASDEVDGAEDFIFTTSSTFCTGIFETLMGKSRVCEHCQQKLINSEMRLKEMHGDVKIYFHPDCKTQRVALEEKKVELHADLMGYFEAKEEAARKAAEAAILAELEAEAAAMEAEKARARSLEVQEPAAPVAAPTPAPKKQSFFSKLFGGCRNNSAVEI
eukprot:Nitzschia sp. Nitz4//scaffold12_size214221//130376//130990//NITZ4_001510-RA/size214221-processed-gene-0.165-mRNA-1//-1//CDS//3329535050//5356//frame0